MREREREREILREVQSRWVLVSVRTPLTVTPVSVIDGAGEIEQALIRARLPIQRPETSAAARSVPLRRRRGQIQEHVLVDEPAAAHLLHLHLVACACAGADPVPLVLVLILLGHHGAERVGQRTVARGSDQAREAPDVGEQPTLRGRVLVPRVARVYVHALSDHRPVIVDVQQARLVADRRRRGNRFGRDGGGRRCEAGALAAGVRAGFPLHRRILFRRRRRVRGYGRGLGLGGALGFPAAAADGDVAEDAALGPVPPAALAEVAGLGEVVVVVVAEFGVERVAARALQRLVVLVVTVLVVVAAVRPQPPVSDGGGSEHPTTRDRVNILHLLQPTSSSFLLLQPASSSSSSNPKLARNRRRTIRDSLAALRDA
ncbi:BSD domain-containing protein [Psidium guajava]|nr:BSD domain-containing protein [Psidium guajava]